MSRSANWKGLAIVFGLILAAAAVCMAIGNTNLAAALIVVAILEGAAHALFIAYSSAKSGRSSSPAP